LEAMTTTIEAPNVMRCSLDYACSMKELPAKDSIPAYSSRSADVGEDGGREDDERKFCRKVVRVCNE
jgi:hypothetical protein